MLLYKVILQRYLFYLLPHFAGFQTQSLKGYFQLSGNNGAEQLPILTKSLLTRTKTDKSIKDNRRYTRWAAI